MTPAVAAVGRVMGSATGLRLFASILRAARIGFSRLRAPVADSPTRAVGPVSSTWLRNHDAASSKQGDDR